jgi:hypothetical protein
MDSMTLATAVVAAIRPVLGAPAEPVALYQLMCSRLAEGTYHETVLRGAQEQPDNDCRVQSLTSALAEAIAGDGEFAAQLASLLAQTEPARYLQALSDSGGLDFTRHPAFHEGRDLVVETRRSPA